MHLPDFMKDNLNMLSMGWFFTFLGLAIILTILLAGTLAWTISSNECAVAQNQYGKSTKYHFLGGGCYIKIQGHSIRLEQYTNFKQVEK